MERMREKLKVRLKKREWETFQMNIELDMNREKGWERERMRIGERKNERETEKEWERDRERVRERKNDREKVLNMRVLVDAGDTNINVKFVYRRKVETHLQVDEKKERKKKYILVVYTFIFERI